jgi:hypothetical protein
MNESNVKLNNKSLNIVKIIMKVAIQQFISSNPKFIDSAL